MKPSSRQKSQILPGRSPKSKRATRFNLHMVSPFSVTSRTRGRRDHLPAAGAREWRTGGGCTMAAPRRPVALPGRGIGAGQKRRRAAGDHREIFGEGARPDCWIGYDGAPDHRTWADRTPEARSGDVCPCTTGCGERGRPDRRSPGPRQRINSPQQLRAVRLRGHPHRQRSSWSAAHLPGTVDSSVAPQDSTRGQSIR